MPVQPLVLQFWNGSAYVDQLTYSSTPAKVTRGTDGESGLRPAKIEIELNNDDNRYDVTDPESPLYGVAGRNTRSRLRVNGITRTQAANASYAPSRTIDHVKGANRGKASCGLTAEGVLRRIMQWSTPLHSPMYRAVTGIANLIGYWPLEDGTASTQLTNAARNGRPGTVGAVTFHGGDGPGGSDQVVKLAPGSQMNGVWTSASTTAGWQVSFAVKLAVLAPSATYEPVIAWSTSNGYRWWWDMNNTTHRINVRDAAGTLLSSTVVGFGAGADPNQWITYRVKVSIAAGTVTVEPAWYPQGAGLLYGTTATFAGTMGRLTTWRVSGGVVLTDALMGHVYGVTTVTDDLQNYALTRAFDGYPGETAADRFVRLCTEEKITRYVTGTANQSMPMGVQRPATFQQHLEQIVATEDALLFDERGDLALRLVLRRARYTQTPAAALTFPAHIAGYEKIIDDLGIKNYIAVKNAGGGEYIAERTTGPLSTAATPAGIDVAKDDVDVNVQDEGALADIGYWYLNKGTIDRARYRSITVDLLANPSLEAAITGIEIGNLITVTGLEKELVPLIVVGTVETIGHVTREIELTCLPADVYNIGIYDDPGSRYDAATSTLAAALTPTATSASITCTDVLDVWSTTAVPYQWSLAGERVTVTAITAGAGSGPYTQTATITRSVNGVVKPANIPIGTQVQLADPVRYGL